MTRARTRRRAGPRRRGATGGGGKPPTPPAAPALRGMGRSRPPPPATPPAPPRRARFRQPLRWRPLTALPAWILALCGLLGLVSTIRTLPSPPPAREPIRYTPGSPLAERLVVLLVPQLDERGVAALKAALGGAAAREGALLTVERPDFASFDEVALQLFAGNVADGVGPALPSEPPGQPPDTLVRGIIWQGRGATLVGPPDWRARFGQPAPPSGTPSTTPAKSNLLLAEAETTLRARQHTMVLVGLRDLAARDLRDEVGSLRADLAALGATVDANDALLIVGGGSIGQPLRLALSGAGVRPSRARAVALNDLTPTCAVLLGAPYPFEARGRIVWPLLEADEARKAAATGALARQRAGLVVGTLPLGAPYPRELLTTLAQLPEIDFALSSGQHAFAYQLASSAADQADRLLATAATVTPLPLPRCAAWALVAVGIVAGLYALALLAASRSWATIAAALIGAIMSLAAWLATTILLQRILTPRLPVVVAVIGLVALVGGGTCARLARLFARRLPFAGGALPASNWRALEALALLAALPVAVCAYRYGLPWQIRLEESAPLFRWRSALLAPLALLLVGYAWNVAQSRPRRRRPVPA